MQALFNYQCSGASDLGKVQAQVPLGPCSKLTGLKSTVWNIMVLFCPCGSVVSDTSNGPEPDVGNYTSAYIFVV